MSNLENELEKLPSYIHCNNCTNRHYLTLNKDIHGRWCIGYTEFETWGTIEELAIGDMESVEEACRKMKKAYSLWREQG